MSFARGHTVTEATRKAAASDLGTTAMPDKNVPSFTGVCAVFTVRGPFIFSAPTGPVSCSVLVSACWGHDLCSLFSPCLSSFPLSRLSNSSIFQPCHDRAIDLKQLPSRTGQQLFSGYGRMLSRTKKGGPDKRRRLRPHERERHFWNNAAGDPDDPGSAFLRPVTAYFL